MLSRVCSSIASTTMTASRVAPTVVVGITTSSFTTASASSLVVASSTSSSLSSSSSLRCPSRAFASLTSTPKWTEKGEVAPTPASLEKDVDVIAEFHLATHDVAKAKTFFQFVLGCHHIQHIPKRQLIVNRFYNHKIICHLQPLSSVEQHANRMPFPAAGVTFRTIEELELLYDQVCKSGWFVVESLRTRWGGQPHEQTFFRIEDPSNNLLEFSCFTHPESAYTQPRL